MPNHSSKPKRPRDLNQLAKFIVDQATTEPGPEPPTFESSNSDEQSETPKYPEKLPAAVELGRRGGLKGGKARAASMTPKQRSEIAKKAAAARWSKKPG